MTKAELLEAIREDDDFANQLIHALLSQCTLTCNARNNMMGGAEYVAIELKAPDGKIILEDSFSIS
jgi:hypothetical protein